MRFADARARVESMFLDGRRRPRWTRIGAVAVAIYLLSGTYFVSADQQALVLRFGRVVDAHVPGGMHWGWPVPIERIYRLRPRETKRLTLGTIDAGNGAPLTQFLTGDRNILNVRLVVQYAINDPAAYLFRSSDVNAAIATATQGALVQALAERQVDDVLTTEKIAVQQRVQTLAEATLARYQCGISLLGVVLDSLQPPDEVVDAFRLVSSAREDSNRIIREAESYANGVIPVARGDADQLVEQAHAYSTRRTSEATGDASRFSAVAEEYKRAPRDTVARLYLETMEEVLPQLDKVVVGTDGKTVDLQFFRIK